MTSEQIERIKSLSESIHLSVDGLERYRMVPSVGQHVAKEMVNDCLELAQVLMKAGTEPPGS